MSRPLTGKTILVTRPADRADKLVRPLEELGAKTYVLPAIDVKPSFDPALDIALERLADYAWVVLTSEFGVWIFSQKLRELGLTWPAGTQLAVIGPATAKKAETILRPPDLMPEEYVSDAIADAIGDVRGQRILLARADRARKDLADRLAAKGAIVDEVASYCIVDAVDSGYELPYEAPDAIALTSSACASGTLANLQSRGKEHWMTESALVCIGPITTTMVNSLGFKPAAMAKQYTIPGLIDALVELLGKKVPA